MEVMSNFEVPNLIETASNCNIEVENGFVFDYLNDNDSIIKDSKNRGSIFKLDVRSSKSTMDSSITIEKSDSFSLPKTILNETRDPTLLSASLTSNQAYSKDGTNSEIIKLFQPKTSEKSEIQIENLLFTESTNATLNLSGEIHEDLDNERIDIIAQLTEKYKKSILLEKSNVLLKKELAKYFYKSKWVKTKLPVNVADEKSIMNTTEKYNKLLKVIQTVQMEAFFTKEICETNKQNCEENKVEKYRAISDNNKELFEYQGKIGLQSKFRHPKRLFKMEDWLKTIKKEVDEKEHQLHLLRLKYFRKQHKVDSLMHNLMEKDVMGANRTLVDFERCQIENYNYHMKHEEFLRHVSKVQSNNDVHSALIAHNKEKVSHLRRELSCLNAEKNDLEAKIEQGRSNLIWLKKRLHQIKSDETKLRKKSGVMRYPKLVNHIDSIQNEMTRKKTLLHKTSDLRQNIQAKVDYLNQRISRTIGAH